MAYEEVIIFVLLFLWLVGTVVAAVDRSSESDLIPNRFKFLFTFVPTWNFFAPHPGQWDYYLLYRHKQMDGSLTKWIEIDKTTVTRQRFRWIWNPYIYPIKSISDMVHRLVSMLSMDKNPGNNTFSSELSNKRTPGLSLDSNIISTKTHLISIEYLLFLNYVSNKSQHDRVQGTQFMLMRSNLRQKEPEPLFISPIHNYD